jgi:hypothetical protein
LDHYGGPPLCQRHVQRFARQFTIRGSISGERDIDAADRRRADGRRRSQPLGMAPDSLRE